MRNFTLPAFLIIFILCYCGDRREVDRDVLVKSYVDILIAEQTYIGDLDSLKLKRSEIFKYYNITPEDYRFTLASFKNDENKWEEFFADANSYLDSLKVRDGIK